MRLNCIHDGTITGGTSIENVDNFLNDHPKRTVWTKNDGGDGMWSDLVDHGHFDDAGTKNMDSVCHIIQHGF
jgi:DNA polymerase sigma